MRITEKDRRELINKLKKVKNPRERDRIIWALAGQEETVFRSANPDMPPSRYASGLPEPIRAAPRKTQSLQNISPVTIDTKRLLGFAVPAFFMIFGLVNIGRAVLNYFATEEIEAEISRLIMGGVFLIIGLSGIFRAMQPKQMKPDEAS